MKNKYEGFTTGYPRQEPIVWEKRQVLQAYVFCVCMIIAGAIAVVVFLTK